MSIHPRYGSRSFRQPHLVHKSFIPLTRLNFQTSHNISHRKIHLSSPILFPHERGRQNLVNHRTPMNLVLQNPFQ
jgi:hypothetical protein